jgi:hypothetical protein
MGMPADVGGPHAEDCPRCGAALRFEDEDGTRECVCGWSERTREPVADATTPTEDGARSPLG